MFLIPYSFSSGYWGGYIINNTFVIQLARPEYLFSTGMLESGALQIAGIEWFVGNKCIRSTAERPHHSSGNIPWPGPHGYPYLVHQ